MNFVLKMMDFVLKMMNVPEVWRLDARQERVETAVNGMVGLMMTLASRLSAMEDDIQASNHAEAASKDSGGTEPEMIVPPPGSVGVMFESESATGGTTATAGGYQ